MFYEDYLFIGDGTQLFIVEVDCIGDVGEVFTDEEILSKAYYVADKYYDSAILLCKLDHFDEINEIDDDEIFTIELKH